MTQMIGLSAAICIGLLGGLVGYKLKFPGGVIICSMLGVIIFKVLYRGEWALPKPYGFVLQVMLGIMVGAMFQTEMVGVIKTLAAPVVLSTLVLVLAGLFMSFIFAKLNVLDMGTAYLGTSPGAMSVLLTLAIESGKNPTVIMTFHFFRVVFIILTLPVMYKLFFR